MNKGKKNLTKGKCYSDKGDKPRRTYGIGVLYGEKNCVSFVQAPINRRITV